MNDSVTWQGETSRLHQRIDTLERKLRWDSIITWVLTLVALTLSVCSVGLPRR